MPTIPFHPPGVTYNGLHATPNPCANNPGRREKDMNTISVDGLVHPDHLDELRVLKAEVTRLEAVSVARGQVALCERESAYGS
jgi:hypothetical protein